jgi:hypothetical protein
VLPSLSICNCNFLIEINIQSCSKKCLFLLHANLLSFVSLGYMFSLNHARQLYISNLDRLLIDMFLLPYLSYNLFPFYKREWYDSFCSRSWKRYELERGRTRQTLYIGNLNLLQEVVLNPILQIDNPILATLNHLFRSKNLNHLLHSLTLLFTVRLIYLLVFNQGWWHDSFCCTTTEYGYSIGW